MASKVRAAVKLGEQQVPWGACPPRHFYAVHSCCPCHLSLSPQSHVGCHGGWLPRARVRMSCSSAGLGCQRGHNPGVLQTPGVSSSAATDIGARRHTWAFWVDAVSKQTKVELQLMDSPPPATAVGFRLNPPPIQHTGSRSPFLREPEPKPHCLAQLRELRLELGSKGPAFCISASDPRGPEGASEPVPQKGQ